MSRSDSEKPPKRPEPTQSHPEPPGINGTRRAIINDRPARAPTWTAPAPRRRHIPDAFVFPQNQSREDRDAFIAWLDQQFGDFIESEMRPWKDIAEESRKDVRQEVLLILSNHYEKQEKENKKPTPDAVEAFLRVVTYNAARTHVRAKKRRTGQIDQEADVDEALDAAPDPEGEAAFAELREKFARYRAQLTEEDREVFEAREVDRMTFEAIAAVFGRPLATVHRIHARAVATLRDLALASERGTVLGRRPGVAFRK